jgi:hypothetical protein
MADAAPISLCAPANALRDWAAAAAIGDVVVYAIGCDVPRDEQGFVTARALSDAGHVELFSRRRADGVREYCARALAQRVVQSSGWTPEARLMAMIAKSGAVRATNAELAEQLGLRNLENAKSLVRKLKAARVISTLFEADGKRVIVKFGAV